MNVMNMNSRVQQQLSRASNVHQITRTNTSQYDGVSVRPQAGSAYSSRNPDKDKTEAPGGRKLWCRLVVAFTCTSIFGLGLIILGAVFMQQAHGVHKTHGMSLPLVWCVVAIVSGIIMMFGSMILGKLIISNKWRKNEQPRYSRVSPSVRYQHRQRERRQQHNTHRDMPPTYEQSIHPSVFIISSENGNTAYSPMNEPPSYVASPPAYSPPSTPARYPNDSHNQVTNTSVMTVAPVIEDQEPAIIPAEHSSQMRP